MKKTVVNGYTIYTSMLYANWFAEQQGKHLFRMRLPYNTRQRAERMLIHLRYNIGSALTPDYRPHIHMIKKGICR